MKRLFAPAALLPHGWADDVLLEVADDGALAAVTPGAEPPAEAERLPGPVVPGVPNLHSHAFQRAMAGLAEVAGPADDSFWTWRQVMYGFLARLTPDDVGAIARLLYIDMLKAGYTAVGEFHYLHHGPDGTPYGDRAELSERVIAAARSAGIGITHLPVLYGNNGFGGAAPSDGQRRFLNSPDALLGLVDTLKSRHGANPDVAVGVAPHSLRATTPEALAAAVAGVPDGPIHIHIAEQTREVDECLAWSGTRPVDWLFDHHAVDGRWCLVHATHVTPAEAARLAISGAVAGLCPTTEANLGDGLFPVTDYAAAGGVMGIGSDSHITVDPAQEMRWLE
ncbi:MAG: formimidoylglutamate deiminase, partial [Rhodobacterales bacterium]|nr:formimidoylglutamate deiminase [Rhodobacterales bacterium]